MKRAMIMLAAALVLGAAAAQAGAGDAPRGWGVGWDDGLTVRRWLDRTWVLSLSAGPDDYLHKDEVSLWLLDLPPQQQGALEVPLDSRQEQGWVRVQAGRRVAEEGPWTLVGFTGLTYNWVDYQERAIELDPLLGDYDTWELDRFTGRWILGLGLRPSWRPHPRVSLEAAFGLQFTWEHWDQTVRRTYAGIDGEDLQVHDGHGRSFQDTGWDGLSSIQIFWWF